MRFPQTFYYRMEIRIEDNDGHTPLDCAVMRNDHKLIEIIIGTAASLG